MDQQVNSKPSQFKGMKLLAANSNQVLDFNPDEEVGDSAEDQSEDFILNQTNLLQFKTTKKELLQWFKQHPNKKVQEIYTKYKMTFLNKLKFNNTRLILLDLEKEGYYWEFRNHQINGIKGELNNELKLLENLKIELTKDGKSLKRKTGEILGIPLIPGIMQESQIKIANSIIDKLHLKRNKFATLEELIKYVENVREMYENIEIKKNSSKEKSYQIMRGEQLLIDISYTENNVIFNIPEKLSPEELKKTILIMVDQSNRYQEMSKNNNVEIFGFKGRPDKAMQILLLCIEAGKNPSIGKATLDAWEKQANAVPENENSQKFKLALKQYQEIQRLSTSEEKMQFIREKVIVKKPKPLPATTTPAAPASSTSTSTTNLPPADPEAKPTIPSTPSTPSSSAGGTN